MEPLTVIALLVLNANPERSSVSPVVKFSIVPVWPIVSWLAVVAPITRSPPVPMKFAIAPRVVPTARLPCCSMSMMPGPGLVDWIVMAPVSISDPATSIVPAPTAMVPTDSASPAAMERSGRAVPIPPSVSCAMLEAARL